MSVFTFGHENKHKRPTEAAEPERHEPTDDDVLDELKSQLGWEPGDSVEGDTDTPLFDSELAGWLAKCDVQEQLARHARKRRCR